MSVIVCTSVHQKSYDCSVLCIICRLFVVVVVLTVGALPGAKKVTSECHGTWTVSAESPAIHSILSCNNPTNRMHLQFNQLHQLTFVRVFNACVRRDCILNLFVTQFMVFIVFDCWNYLPVRQIDSSLFILLALSIECVCKLHSYIEPPANVFTISPADDAMHLLYLYCVVPLLNVTTIQVQATSMYTREYT